MSPVASPVEEVGVDAAGIDYDEGEEEEPCEDDLVDDPPQQHASIPRAIPESIPSIHDKSAPKPRAGELQLSQNAIKSRMRRVFTPTLKGTLKVSQAVMNDWHSSGGPRSQKRRQLEQIFQLCGYDPELWHTNTTTCSIFTLKSQQVDNNRVLGLYWFLIRRQLLVAQLLLKPRKPSSRKWR